MITHYVNLFTREYNAVKRLYRKLNLITNGAIRRSDISKIQKEGHNMNIYLSKIPNSASYQPQIEVQLLDGNGNQVVLPTGARLDVIYDRYDDGQDGTLLTLNSVNTVPTTNLANSRDSLFLAYVNVAGGMSGNLFTVIVRVLDSATAIATETYHFVPSNIRWSQDVYINWRQ